MFRKTFGKTAALVPVVRHSLRCLSLFRTGFVWL